MKKILSSLAMTAVFASLAILPAEALDKCIKLNSVKKVNGQKFVCTKNKSYLVWKKQTLTPIIKIEKSTPVVQQTTITGQEAIPVKVDVPVVAETSTIQESVLIFDIDHLSITEVYKKSREQINSKINKSIYDKNIFNFRVAPEVNLVKLQNEKDSLTKASKLWSDIYSPRYTVETIFYTYDSLQWAKDTFRSITGQEGINQSNNCKPDWCGNASNNIIGNKPIVYEQGMGGLDLTLRQTSAHEYTHLAQTTANRDYWSIAPLWMVEGMAEFYGEAIGFSSFDVDGSTRKNIHKIFASYLKSMNQGNIKDQLLLNDKSVVKSIFLKIEFPQNRYSQESATLAYLVGGYANEVLVAVYGQEKVEAFITSFSKSNNWELNFYNSFGIHKDDFYHKITMYLSEVAKEL